MGLPRGCCDRHGVARAVELTNQRARLLHAALGFASLDSVQPELRLFHRWLDSWSGVGYVVAGMARQEYDLELRRYDGQAWHVIAVVAA
jgi:hypothetical protein